MVRFFEVPGFGELEGNSLEGAKNMDLISDVPNKKERRYTVSELNMSCRYVNLASALFVF
jgi:hypothetical protein